MSQNQEITPKREGWEGGQEIGSYKSSEKKFSFFFTFFIISFTVKVIPFIWLHFWIIARKAQVTISVN